MSQYNLMGEDMKMLWTSLKKYKKSILFINIIFLLGLISGFIYFYMVKDSIVLNLQEELLNVQFSSNILYHIVFLAVIFLFSYLGLGVFIGLFLYFYEALSVGFVLATYFSLAGLSGVLYAIIYVTLFKTFYIFLMSLILIKTIKLVKSIIGYFMLHKDSNMKDSILISSVNITKYIIIILVYDIFLIFLGNQILSIFNFLI